MKIKPTILMKGINKTPDLMMLTVTLCKMFNSPTTRFDYEFKVGTKTQSFNAKEIIGKIYGEEYSVAYSIFKECFSDAVYFIDELPEGFKAIVNPENQSVIYDGLALAYKSIPKNKIK